MGIFDSLRRKPVTKVDPVYLVVVNQPTLPSHERTMAVVGAFVATGDLAPPTLRTRILSMCYQEPWREDNDPDFLYAVVTTLLERCPDLSGALQATPTRFRRSERVSYSTINGTSTTGERFRCVEIMPK
jgi:hypothetical protein